MRLAADLLHDAGRTGNLSGKWRMHVTDRSGKILFSVRFDVLKALMAGDEQSSLSPLSG